MTTQSKTKKPVAIKWWWFVLLSLAILLILIGALLIPWNTSGLSSRPNPAKDYEDAIRRIEVLRAAESPDMNPLCRLKLLTHEQKVERVVIFVHGYANCPQQFSELGQQFYDLGYNVLIAPLPYHGLADPLTEVHGQLKAEDLTAYADETVDIASGLGEEVVMTGISAGGVTTAWAAQNRDDIDLAVVISPAYGTQQVPTVLLPVVTNLFTMLPDSFEWWDPVLKADVGPAHAYPRYSRHALAQIFRLGFIVRAQSRQASPLAHSILVVTNANDDSVDNAIITEVVNNWSNHNAKLKTFEFDASLNLIHDMIDPAQKGQKINIVYPRLIEMITNLE